MELYTMEQWHKDRTFQAVPGQEITADIYENMLNCMPPRKLPQEKAQEALQAYNIPVHVGFLMGEPHSSYKHGQYYLAFGMNDYGKGKHYYYLGLSRPARTIRDGVYYYLDCMNAFTSGLFRVEEFEDDADAIQTAANYEATLYKDIYRNGERISRAVLYEPRFM